MKRKTLLLIESNQVQMDINRRKFERAGYIVSCALGIEHAREQLTDVLPDGIILSGTHSNGRGIATLSLFRTKYNVPILLLSDHGELEAMALKSGANDFLRKPYDFEVLLARIELMLKRAEQPEPNTETNDDDDTANIQAVGDIAASHRESEQTTQAVRELLEITNTSRSSKIQRIAAACLAIVVVAGVLISILLSLDRAPEVYLPDSPIPLASVPRADPGDEIDLPDNDVPLTNTPQNPDTPISDLPIPNYAIDLPMNLSNPEGNPYHLIFEVVLTDTGETLYISDRVAPGESIDQVTIIRDIEDGEQSATLMIHTFLPDTDVPTSSVSVDFIIFENN